MLTNVTKVWVAWLASLSSLAVAFVGTVDLTIMGHAMAGERFVYVPLLAIQPVAVWLAGRRSDYERTCCRFTLAALAVAFITAPISYEQFSWGWLAHQFPMFLAAIGLVMQLGAWREQAGSERIGVTIMLVGAIAELVELVGTQSTAWDALCEAGMRVTCTEGPWAPYAIPGAELLALLLWTGLIVATVRGTLRRS